MNLLRGRPRLRRYIGALIATAVTTWVAAHNLARSEESVDQCTRHDVAAWHLALLEPETPPSPMAVLETTEAFLSTCPNRPEAQQALAIAGMASVDLGNADRALSYFEQVDRLTTLRQKFYHTSALLAVGREGDAWDLRDELIDSWLADVTADADAEMSMRVMPAGRLIHLKYSNAQRLDGVQSAWIALPDDAGWPAAIRLTQSPEGRFQPVELFSLAQDVPTYVELYRCRSRRFLARIASDLEQAETQANAYAALTAYLADPDPVPMGESDAEIRTCLWPDRLLPQPGG